MDFEGKTGLVLGVANKRSIAWAIAQRLADGRRAARVHVPGRADREERARPRGDRSTARSSPRATSARTRTSRASSARSGEAFDGGLDLLVHSVAFAAAEDLEGRFTDTPRDRFWMALDVSAYSLVACARAAEPLMEARGGGSIVTMTYLGGERAVPHYNVMGVAKATLDSSVKYLAWDLGQKNIRVNAISAGPVRTLAARSIAGFPTMEAIVEERAPLHRHVDADDVGAAAAYLLSDDARNVTGHDAVRRQRATTRWACRGARVELGAASSPRGQTTRPDPEPVEQHPEAVGAVLVVADALREHVDRLRIDEWHPRCLVDDLPVDALPQPPRGVRVRDLRGQGAADLAVETGVAELGVVKFFREAESHRRGRVCRRWSDLARRRSAGSPDAGNGIRRSSDRYQRRSAHRVEGRWTAHPAPAGAGRERVPGAVAIGLEVPGGRRPADKRAAAALALRRARRTARPALRTRRSAARPQTTSTVRARPRGSRDWESLRCFAVSTAPVAGCIFVTLPDRNSRSTGRRSSSTHVRLVARRWRRIRCRVPVRGLSCVRMLSFGRSPPKICATQSEPSP